MPEHNRYLPHHHDEHEDDIDTMFKKAICWMIIASIVGMLVICGFHSCDKQHAIDEAYHSGRREMRQQILNANKDILKGHAEYQAQVDRQIKKAYGNWEANK